MRQGIKTGPIARQTGGTLTQARSRAWEHEHCSSEYALETGCDQVRVAWFLSGITIFLAYHQQIMLIKSGQSQISRDN
jgi:hypothetical protein